MAGGGVGWGRGGGWQERAGRGEWGKKESWMSRGGLKLKEVMD